MKKSALISQDHLPNLLIRNPNFFLLWAAYGISAIGDHLSEVALLAERGGLDRTDSTRVQALIQFGFFFPFVLLAPIAGWCADRFSRKHTMIASDILRGILMANLALIVPWLAGVLPDEWDDYSIVLPLFAAGALASFFSPARQAMLPTLIRDDQLIRANALTSALGTIGAIASAVLAGIIFDRFGKHWNYRVDALTFFISAALLACISLRNVRHVRPEPAQGVLRPLLEGFRFVRDHRRVWRMILLGTVFWAAAGVVMSIIPALVRDVFGGSLADSAMFRGIVGIGLVVGAAFMTVAGSALPIQTAVLVSLAGATLWVLALAGSYSLKLGQFVTALCLFGIGGAGSALLVTVMACIQHFVPDSRRGRVIGVADMMTMGAMVASTGLLGLPNIPNLDRYVPYLLGLVALLLGSAFIFSWREYRRHDVHPAALSIVWRISTFYARAWCRVKRIGPCMLPRTGPVILAANHTAGIDPILIYATCRYRVISFLVEQKYYNVPIAHWFQKMVGCIPVDRENPSKSTISTMLKLLKDGGCLGIFPQGTFEKPGEDLGGKSGIGMIALRTGATIVPCHISGTKYFDSVFRSFITRHNVRIRYGKPIDLSQYAGRERNKDAQDELSQLVMQRIKELAPETA